MSEIEDFLRKAAQRRKDKKKKAPPLPPPAAAEPTVPIQPLQQQPLSQPLQSQTRPSSFSRELQNRHVVENSVHQHFDTSGDPSRAESGGFADLELVDERMEEHLHERFDRAIGSLKESAATSGARDNGAVAGNPVGSADSSWMRDSKRALQSADGLNRSMPRRNGKFGEP